MDNDIAQKIVSVIDRLTLTIEQLKLRTAPSEELYSAQSFAERLDCSVSSILKGVRNGTFPQWDVKLFKGEKGLRWTRQTVEAFIASKSKFAPEVEEPAPPYVRMKKRGRKAA